MSYRTNDVDEPLFYPETPIKTEFDDEAVDQLLSQDDEGSEDISDEDASTSPPLPPTGPPDAAQDVKMRADRKKRDFYSSVRVAVAPSPKPLDRKGKGKEREREKEMTSLGGGSGRKRRWVMLLLIVNAICSDLSSSSQPFNYDQDCFLVRPLPLRSLSSRLQPN